MARFVTTVNGKRFLYVWGAVSSLFGTVDFGDTLACIEPPCYTLDEKAQADEALKQHLHEECSI